MNLPLRPVLFAWACLAFALRAAADDASQAPLVIVNFTEPVSELYGYGSWQAHFGVAPKSGIRVLGNKGAQGDGGFCRAFEPAADLSKRAHIEVALAVQPGNEVPNYTICFEDADGTSCSARLFVAQLMPGQPVWLRVAPGDFAASAKQSGNDGKMDWSKIAKWHLQGDWVTKKPANVLFIAIRVRDT